MAYIAVRLFCKKNFIHQGALLREVLKKNETAVNLGVKAKAVGHFLLLLQEIVGSSFSLGGTMSEFTLRANYR